MIVLSPITSSSDFIIWTLNFSEKKLNYLLDGSLNIKLFSKIRDIDEIKVPLWNMFTKSLGKNEWTFNEAKYETT